MKRTFTYPIRHEMAGMTIQSFLKQQQYSSQVITHLKRTPDGVCRNGVWARVHEVFAKWRSSYDFHRGKKLPQSTSFPSSLFQSYTRNKDLLVINKPSGMPIRPSQEIMRIRSPILLYYCCFSEHSFHLPLYQPLRPGYYRASDQCQTYVQRFSFVQYGRQTRDSSRISCRCHRSCRRVWDD